MPENKPFEPNQSDKAIWNQLKEPATRIFHLATNDGNAILSLLPELCIGRNEVTRMASENYCRRLNEISKEDTTPIGRIRRQTARILWDLWHDAYDLYPWTPTAGSR
jgi:hypothetical protein